MRIKVGIPYTTAIIMVMIRLCTSYATGTSILAAEEEPKDLLCEPPPKLENGFSKIISMHSDGRELLSGINAKTVSLLKEKEDEESNYLPTEGLELMLPPNSRLLYPRGSVTEHHCKNGFWLHPASASRHTCVGGEWLGEKPFCVAKGCYQPNNLMNGYYLELSESSDNLYPPGARLQLLCHAGYLLKGPDIFTCDDAGHWSPENEPQCLPSPQILNSKKCSLPPDVWGATQKLLQGVVGAGGAVHQTVVEYRCKSGFRNVVAPCVAHSLTCHQGEWHGTSPQCKEFTSCIAPPNIANGYLYKVASSYPLQSQVYYSCEHGYRLIGPSVLTCEETGCWNPNMPPVCQLNQLFSEETEERTFNIHTLLVAAISGVISVLFLLLALLLYHRAVSPKLLRLRNGSSGSDLEPGASPLCPPTNGQTQTEHDPDRVALIAFPDDLINTTQGVPPTYEEAVRQRPTMTFDHQSGRYTPHTHRSRGHRVVVSGVRRPRHRDNPDNISYQSIGSTRQSSSTSRSMSVRSWSACDSLGSTDTVAISDSTNVTVDTMSTGACSSASQTTSCRGLAGSRASFDTSSLINNEGAPLLEEVEGEDFRSDDQYSLSTRDSDSLKDNVSHTRSITVSLQE